MPAGRIAVMQWRQQIDMAARLEGKGVVVAGGSRGLGAAIAGPAGFLLIVATGSTKLLR